MGHGRNVHTQKKRITVHPVDKIKTKLRQATVHMSMKLWQHLMQHQLTQEPKIKSTQILGSTDPSRKGSYECDFFLCLWPKQCCSECQLSLSLTHALSLSQTDDSLWLSAGPMKRAMKSSPEYEVFTDRLMRATDVHLLLSDLIGLRCKASLK